jgi:hypothetical protein
MLQAARVFFLMAINVETFLQAGIAVTNAEIEEIWAMVPVGTPVEIRP